MFIKHINKNGLIKYITSISKNENSIQEEVKFVSTQTPHADFLSAISNLSNSIIEEYIHEVGERIVVSDIFFDWSEHDDIIDISNISCGYELHNKNGKIGKISLQKIIPSVAMLNASKVAINESVSFMNGKTGESNLFNFEFNNNRISA